MKRFFSFFLALMMLATNVGATINTHICGGKKAKTAISFGISNLSCGMDRMAGGCENLAGNGLKSKSCCDNQTFQLSVDVDTDFPVVELGLAQIQLLAVWVESYSLHFESRISPQTKYLNYIPPLLQRDLPVLIQSFLI